MLGHEKVNFSWGWETPHGTVWIVHSLMSLLSSIPHWTHILPSLTLRILSTDSKNDFTDNFVPWPKACSCPNKTENRVDQRKRQTKKPVKINNINFQSINNKKANLLHLIDTDKPDVYTGSEMWLNNTISSSEIFPPNNVLRSDHSCGGPVVAMV